MSGWGQGYFRIDAAGRVRIDPTRGQGPTVALTDVVDTFVKADGLAPGRIVNQVTGER